MPLHVRNRAGTSILWLIGTIEGRRIRESTGTSNPVLAEAKRAARETQLFKEAVAGLPPTVSFSRAVASYLRAENPGPTQLAVVSRLERVLGSTPTREISQVDCDRARDALCRPQAKPSTVVRTVVSPLTSVLRHAARRGWCERPDLEWPQISKAPFNFFTPDQANALLDAMAGHAQPLVLFLLCSGARIGEALRLDWGDVDMVGGRAIFWEGATKSGKRRVAHLVPRAISALAAMPHRDGRVFRRDDGEPYTIQPGHTDPIRSAWTTACRRAGLPGMVIVRGEGKRGRTFAPAHTPHDCRHTFASWHYAVHRDLLKLRHEVGWSSTEMVERYAHVMPAGHEDAIREFWSLSRHDFGTDTAEHSKKSA